MAMSREELIARLQWNSGGSGLGSIAGIMSWAMDHPGEGKPDLKSIVAVSGPPEKYTDEELVELVAFSDKKTAEYDEMFRYRRGANLICIDKTADGRWMRKRLTWEMGPFFSDSLGEALTIFERRVTVL